MAIEEMAQGQLRDLRELGFTNVADVHWNFPTAALYEEITRRHEGLIAHEGPAVVYTGEHTGRSPDDKFFVQEPNSKDLIWWEGTNGPFAPERFATLTHRILAYLQGKEIFVQDCYVGADRAYRLPVRVITETA